MVIFRTRLISIGRRAWSVALVGFLLLLGSLFSQAAEGSKNFQLDWNPSKQTLSASIDGVPLTQVLQKLVSLTGWQVRVEPDLQYSVFAKFRDLPVSKGLRRLFGTLNFALLEETCGRYVLYVFQGSIHDATQLIHPLSPSSKPRPHVIPNELIVWLAPDAPISIEELARQLKAQIVAGISNLRAYRLRFPSAAAAQAARKILQAMDGVSFGVNESFPWPELLTRAAPTTAVPTIPIRPAKRSGSTPIVALVDTPVRTDDPQVKAFLLPEINIVEPKSIPSDRPTHGTSMAVAVLQGLASRVESGSEVPVRILPINVYPDEQSTTTFEIIAGIDAAIRSGADVINLSLGSDVDHPLIRQLIQAGTAQGIVFVAAAGNEPTGRPIYPAAYPEVTAVTALEPDGSVAPYANRGPFVDVAAPGTTPVIYQNKIYWVEGTSPAAAFASGVAAWTILTRHEHGPAVLEELKQELPPTPEATNAPPPQP